MPGVRPPFTAQLAYKCIPPAANGWRPLDPRYFSTGEASADGRAPPLTDRIHKLMQLWKTDEQGRVDGYPESHGLWRHELFARVVQELIELADGGSEERATPWNPSGTTSARAAVLPLPARNLSCKLRP